MPKGTPCKLLLLVCLTGSSLASARASPVDDPDGRHAFDILDDDETSRGIVRRTMEFIQQHLAAKPQ